MFLRYIWLCLLIILGLTCAGIASEPDRAVLQGRVQHSTGIKAFSSFLPGQVYDPSKLVVKSSTHNEWHRVPKWLAGRWHMQEENYYSVHDFKKGSTDNSPRTEVMIVDTYFGEVADRKGDVWQRTRLHTGRQAHAHTIEFTPELAITRYELKDDQLTEHNLFLKVIVDKRTGIIKHIEQAENIQKCSAIDERHFRMDTSAQIFDLKGKPIRLEKSYVIATRIGEYGWTNMHSDGKGMTVLIGGEDLDAKFRDYLISHHLEHLVPAQWDRDEKD